MLILVEMDFSTKFNLVQLSYKPTKFTLCYESSLVLFQEAKIFKDPKRTRINYLTDLTGLPKKSIEVFF